MDRRATEAFCTVIGCANFVGGIYMAARVGPEIFGSPAGEIFGWSIAASGVFGILFGLVGYQLWPGAFKGKE